MSDPKYDKALRTIASLKKVVEHPNTGDGERAAAQGRIDALKAKWNITDAPKPPPRAKPSRENSPWGSNNPYINADDLDEWLKHFTREKEPETEAEKTARRIENEKREYERWKKANDAMLRRQAAQRAWEERNRARDANGVPLTDAEREEAMRDPLGWAARRDGRTEAEKNADMQNQYSHAYEHFQYTSDWPTKDEGSSQGGETNRCSKPLPFYTSGGEPRKRNEYPTYCQNCGTQFAKGEGAIFLQGGKWVAQCVEQVPGPRKKKPGRG